MGQTLITLEFTGSSHAELDRLWAEKPPTFTASLWIKHLIWHGFNYLLEQRRQQEYAVCGECLWMAVDDSGFGGSEGHCRSLGVRVDMTTATTRSCPEFELREEKGASDADSE